MVHGSMLNANRNYNNTACFLPAAIVLVIWSCAWVVYFEGVDKNRTKTNKQTNEKPYSDSAI